MRARQSIAESKAGDMKPLILNEFLPYQISVIAECIAHVYAFSYGQRFNLSIAEWRVMAVLGECGQCATQDVIARTEMDRVKTSRAAIRLTDRGLIARWPMPGDQRTLLLRLTDQGNEIYHQIIPLARTLQAEIEKGLTTEERAVLTKLLPKLYKHVSEIRSRHGAPACA
jgi:DNA-binding MarR family transcriptional regulator